MIDRFGGSEDAGILTDVARALVNKGVTLKTMGKPEEALAAYDSVIDRFGGSEDAGILKWVAGAYENKALMIYELKDISRLDMAIQAAENAIKIFPNDNTYHHTLASVYGLGGRWPEAFEKAMFFANDPVTIGENPEEILEFFIFAAAAGEPEAALEAINKTAAAASLEPLVVALKILSGVDFHAPQEVMAVASDIVKKVKNIGDKTDKS